jgi:pilus assembly protein CpaB
MNEMNKRFVGVLIFAFVVASVASLLLYRLLASSRPTSAKVAATIHLAIAAHNLEAGVVLKESDVKMAEWTGPAPEGAFTQIRELVGRGVTTPMVSREPILESRIASKGAGGGLASMIPEGMRAVAIRVNDVAGVAGFVTPGMRVDVLISGTPGANNASAALGVQSKTMLQNVEVLSAGQDFKKDAEGKPITVQVVNLLVTPEQAEMLSLASTQTNWCCAIRWTA